MAFQPVSLMARAVGLLARREQSPQELTRKLGRHTEDVAEIERVVGQLQAKGLLSEERFAASLVHRRAPGKGSSRVLQELRQHGVSADSLAQARETLAGTELERAQQAWAKRFGEPPATPQDRLRQMRFLAGRGFSHDIIRRVIPSGRSSDTHDDTLFD